MLLVVKNYDGDVMNFDMAAEMVSRQVATVIVDDDVSIERARLAGMGVTILQRPCQDAAESCDCVDSEGNIFQIAGRVRLPNLFGRV